MQQSNAPAKLVLPFANAGAKNTIPASSQIGITPGAASLTDGFPPLTRTPLVAGGVPPSGLDMNGILFALAAIDRWSNAGGRYAYDSTFATDANVNGYPRGAVVLRSDGQGGWLNTVDNNTTDPEAGGAGWVPDFQYGITSVTMTNANVTLTSLQAGRPIVEITGLLTANLNLNFPTYLKTWTVVNKTTGAFTITAKTVAGSGIVVVQNASTQIYGNGTNIDGTTVTVSDASTSVKGVVQLATSAEAIAGTNTTKSVTPQAMAAAISSVQGSFSNLKVSATGTSNPITITADEIVTGNGSGLYQALRTWSGSVSLAASGANGLDTGTSAASTWYYIFAISTDAGGKAFLASLSASAPTLPATYTKWARIGSVRTDASINKYPLSFIQTGRRVQYKVVSGSNVAAYPQMAAQTTALSSSWVAVSMSAVVPPTVASIIGFVASIVTTNSANVSVAPNNTTTPGSLPAYANPMPRHMDGNNTSVSLPFDFIPESTNLYWCGPGTGTTSNVMACEGYTDNF